MEITNEKLLQIVAAYSKENEVEVFKDIELNDYGLGLDVDQGFIDYFEEKHPGVNLDEKLENLFSVLIELYTKEIEDEYS